MKKEIIGIMTLNADCKEEWTFESETKSYSSNVCCALDELLEETTDNGQKFKITIDEIVTE